MFEIDFKSRKTIYEQVVDNIKELILVGVIHPNQKIPSVRELSKILTVNPNTVQKAYSELERLKYIYTLPGRGTFVLEKNGKEPLDNEQIENSRKSIALEIRELYYLGLSKEKIYKMVDDLIECEGNMIEKRRSE